MAQKTLPYEKWIEDALRGVLRKALTKIEADGLPGDHHLYITLATGHEGLEIPDVLKAQYPDEVTIVLQHQFRDLLVTRRHFEVVLSFGGVSHRLRVPFAAVISFADPSVDFGLHVKNAGAASAPAPAPALVAVADESIGDEAPDAALAPELATLDDDDEITSDDEGEDDAREATAEVIALDAFRKK